MTEQTRAEKEAEIRKATLMMWGSAIISCIILAVLFYKNIIPAKYRVVLGAGFVVATVWNLYVVKSAIKKMRASLENV